APTKILTIPDDQFKSIKLQKTGGDTTVVEKSDAGKWQITQPKPLAADQDSVSSLVSTLSSLTSDRLIEDKPADVAPWGLANPPLEVIVTKKDGKTEDLLVRKLKDAKMDTTVSDEDARKAVTAFGAGTKVAASTVADSAGTQTIEVRKDKDKNYYAKSSAVEGIYKVAADLGDGLDKDL